MSESDSKVLMGDYDTAKLENNIFFAGNQSS